MLPARAVLAARPRTVRAVAVLDWTKEPGSLGEPHYAWGPEAAQDLEMPSR